jgi:nicotinamide-nucleotide amidase
MMQPVPESSIIAVGNEILGGFTVDTNSNWLAAQLFASGYPVRFISVVSDTEEDIATAIRQDVERTWLARIFVCGGLGPTPDDRTYSALAQALNRRLVYRREIGDQMQSLMFLFGMAARRGTAELNAGNRKMAFLPEGATLLGNGRGMAPGLAFEISKDRFLFALPGVPHELKSIFLDSVKPDYLRNGRGSTVRELRYRAAPESAFFDVMRALEREYPDVSLGSYPQTENRELILRASGLDPKQVDAVLGEIRKRMTRFTPVDA